MLNISVVCLYDSVGLIFNGSENMATERIEKSQHSTTALSVDAFWREYPHNSYSSRI